MQYYCIVGIGDMRKEYALQGAQLRTRAPLPYERLPIVSGPPCEVWLYPVAGHGHVAHVMLAQAPHSLASPRPGDLPGRTLVHTGPGREAYAGFVAYAALLNEGKP